MDRVEVRSVEELRSAAAPIAAAFAAGGHRLYAVGGIVRDLLLHGTDARSDWDFTTDATPEESRRVLAPLATALWIQGERFGTIAAVVDGRELEVTTHRAEVYDPDSRKPTVAFVGTDLLTDLSRRDFTVNAMAVEVTGDSSVVEDPFGGREDLREHRLRTPLDPVVSFTDDPLRMLRAARFITRFDLQPAEELTAAVVAGLDRLSIVSAERVRDELVKLLGAADPAPGIRFLSRTGLLARVLPELVEPPNLAAAAQRAEELSRLPVDPVLRLVAWWGDATDPAGLVERLGALRMSTADRGRARQVAEVHPWLGARVHDGGTRWGDADLRRLVARHGEVLPAALRRWELADDAPTRAATAELAADLARLEAAGELDDLGAELDGADVMAQLGIPAGPVVGEALRMLAEARLERGRLGPDAARDLLARWWDHRPPTEGSGGD